MAFDSFLSLIILLGAVQGFIVSSILFFSPSDKRIANRYLAGIIFLISVASIGVYLMEVGIKHTSDSWALVSQVVPFFVVMPIGPLIYFYVKAFSSRGSELLPNDNWHFLPVVIDLVPQALFMLFYAGVLPLSLVSLNRFVDDYNAYSDVPRWISVTLYLIFSLRYLNTLQDKRSENTTERNWLRNFIQLFLVFQVVWFGHLVPYIIPAWRTQLLDAVGWYPVYLPLAALIYYFGIKGILTSYRTYPKNVSTNPKLSAEKIRTILAQLEKAMINDKLFLQPELTVAVVSGHINVPVKQISQVVNHAASKSFNEFVNSYRIEEFKKRIGDSKFGFMTVSGIALECGFNSQATFQRSFKAMEGVSPTEYMNLHKNARITA